jgi:hypothetical protein
MSTKFDLEGTVEEVQIVPSSEKLAKLKTELKKLINLAIRETTGDLKASLINKLVEVVIIVESAEKGETNVGRNSSYPE